MARRLEHHKKKHKRKLKKHEARVRGHETYGGERTGISRKK